MLGHGYAKSDPLAATLSGTTKVIHPWPGAVDDGLSVYRELSQRPFAVMGESAGGYFSYRSRFTIRVKFWSQGNLLAPSYRLPDHFLIVYNHQMGSHN